MDPRLLSVVFLLMAGVLPLRELTSRWADRPERRNAVRALWIVYVLVAAGAMTALAVVERRERAPFTPSPDGSEQLACGPGCADGAARA